MATEVIESVGLPLLEAGDRLSRDEFEHRYERMPNTRAELIEGIVYMASPVRYQHHDKPNIYLATWLGTYAAETPGVEPILNASLRLDRDNEPQPDAGLFRLPSHGGKVRINEDDYIEGAPELLAEVAGSSRAYDLHSKKEAYRRNGVLEYLVWITGENRVIWWTLRRGEYHELTADADGVLRSKVFPGLWLDVPALLRGELKTVLDVLRGGFASR